LMSNEQLTAGLETAGVDEATEAEVLSIYDAARVEAFQAGTAFLVFLALVGMLLTPMLSDRKLVEMPVDAVGIG